MSWDNERFKKEMAPDRLVFKIDEGSFPVDERSKKKSLYKKISFSDPSTGKFKSGVDIHVLDKSK